MFLVLTYNLLHKKGTTGNPEAANPWASRANVREVGPRVLQEP